VIWVSGDKLRMPKTPNWRCACAIHDATNPLGIRILQSQVNAVARLNGRATSVDSRMRTFPMQSGCQPRLAALEGWKGVALDSKSAGQAKAAEALSPSATRGINLPLFRHRE
jgi:hypothetical protein